MGAAPSTVAAKTRTVIGAGRRATPTPELGHPIDAVGAAQSSPEAGSPSQHHQDVQWAAQFGVRTVQTSLLEARAIALQMRAEADEKAAAEAAAAAAAAEALRAEREAAAPSRLRRVVSGRGRSGSELEPEPEPEPEPELGTQLVVADERDEQDQQSVSFLEDEHLLEALADFRVVADAPVVDRMSHGGAVVGWLGAGDLIQEVATRSDDFGGEWVRSDGHRCQGWVSVLASDGRTLQLSQDHQGERRKVRRKLRKALLARSGTGDSLAASRDRADQAHREKLRIEARLAGQDEPDAKDGAASVW